MTPELVDVERETPAPKSQAPNPCFLEKADDAGFAKWQEWVRTHCSEYQVNGPVLADIAGQPYIFGHGQHPWFLHEQWRVGVAVELAAQADARAQMAEAGPGVAIADARAIPRDAPQSAPRRRR